MGCNLVKILLSAPTVFIDGKTGDSTHLRELATNLFFMNDKIEVHSRIKENNNGQYHFKFFPINMQYELNNVYNIVLYMCYIFGKTFALFAKNRYDCVYERHHIFNFASIFGVLLSIPTILEVNGLMVEESKDQGKFGSIALKIAEKWEMYIFSLVDTLIIGSKELEEILICDYAISSEKIKLIPNGANTEIFKPIEGSKSILGFDESKKYVCFIGNLVSWQGLDYLIECAPHVVKKIPNVVFVIVGTGFEEERLKEKVKESVFSKYFIFTGAVPYQDVPLYINASDICITLKKELVSGYSPTKLYEYMACGKPVIASDFSGHQILSEFMQVYGFKR
jgi:glycosyltransferase involved in cell wall biosynthesis